MLVGFALEMFAEPLRVKILGPKLVLDIGKDDCFISKTELSNGANGVYVRARVRNAKGRVAKQCRAYLTNIRTEKDKGNFIGKIYQDSIQLKWSCRADSADETRSLHPIDIPKGINQFFDIFVFISGALAPRVETAVWPLRYKEILNTPGKYEVTLVVSGDGVPPEKCVFIMGYENLANITVEQPRRSVSRFHTASGSSRRRDRR